MCLSAVAAGIGAAGSIGEGLLKSRAADKAGDAAQAAATQAANVQWDMFATTRRDSAPYRTAGYNALAALMFENGLGPRPTADGGTVFGGSGTNPNGVSEITTHNLRDIRWNGYQGTLSDGSKINVDPGFFKGANPLIVYKVGDRAFRSKAEADRYAEMNQPIEFGGFDYAGFRETPSYRFRLNEGLDAVERRMAARGLRNSGPSQQSLNDYAQGIAGQEYGDFLNRLAALAGVGQVSTAQSGQFGMQAAGNIGNALMQGGNARASSYLNQANAWGDALSGVGTSIGYGLSNWGAPNPYTPLRQNAQAIRGV